MGRREQLIECFKDISEEKKATVLPLIDECVFLEEQLATLRKLPMTKSHPDNPQRVKATESAKLYKEFLQQYNNTLKNLLSLFKKNEEKEKSPLRIYLENLNNDKEN